MKHPLSVNRTVTVRTPRAGQHYMTGVSTVLDEDVFEEADASDLIECARNGDAIALDIDY